MTEPEPRTRLITRRIARSARLIRKLMPRRIARSAMLIRKLIIMRIARSARGGARIGQYREKKKAWKEVEYERRHASVTGIMHHASFW